MSAAIKVDGNLPPPLDDDEDDRELPDEDDRDWRGRDRE